MRVLVFGDSITQGFWAVDGGWVERLRRHYDALALEDLEHNRQPEIFNLGISGDTTRNLLDRIEQETKVRRWPGSRLVVVIAIGTNDDLFEHDKRWVSPEEFAANLEKIITILSPLADGLLFVGNPACDEAKTTPVSWADCYYTNDELAKSEQLIERVTRQHELSYVPIFEAFKHRLDAGEDLLVDGLHPNDAGHQFIADMVLPELDAVIKRTIKAVN
jgi:lysophospholipase L1-like esterase